MAEGIVTRHFPEYDHFGMNDLPRSVGQAVIGEWREVAGRLETLDAHDAHAALNLDVIYREVMSREIVSHRKEIAELLRQLADASERFYRANDWICILGM
jgi:hypothetical protein